MSGRSLGLRRGPKSLRADRATAAREGYTRGPQASGTWRTVRYPVYTRTYSCRRHIYREFGRYVCSAMPKERMPRGRLIWHPGVPCTQWTDLERELLGGDLSANPIRSGSRLRFPPNLSARFSISLLSLAHSGPLLTWGSARAERSGTSLPRQTTEHRASSPAL